eukprot:15466827-Alexandrium_andersonii.AAC.1
MRVRTAGSDSIPCAVLTTNGDHHGCGVRDQRTSAGPIQRRIPVGAALAMPVDQEYCHSS